MIRRMELKAIFFSCKTEKRTDAKPQYKVSKSKLFKCL